MTNVDERREYAIRRQAEERAALAPLNEYLNPLTNTTPGREWAAEADRTRKINDFLATFNLNKAVAAQELAEELKSPETPADLVKLITDWLGETDARAWNAASGNAFGIRVIRAIAE